MTTWLKPFWWKTPEAATTATPLAVMKTWFVAEATASASPHGLCNAACKGVPSLCDMLVGNMPGCIGEVSAIALAIGAAYLLWRKVITWHIPVAFIATVFVYSLIAGGAPAMMQVLTGGVMIGACFMATDYVTSPITAKGKLIFGFGCGLLCMLIRQFGSYPEGCSFAILIMNALCPLVNRWTQPKPFGAK
jgi:electron transport complex protein RnfD